MNHKPDINDSFHALDQNLVIASGDLFSFMNNKNKQNNNDTQLEISDSDIASKRNYSVTIDQQNKTNELSSVIDLSQYDNDNQATTTPLEILKEPMSGFKVKADNNEDIKSKNLPMASMIANKAMLNVFDITTTDDTKYGESPKFSSNIEYTNKSKFGGSISPDKLNNIKNLVQDEKDTQKSQNPYENQNETDNADDKHKINKVCISDFPLEKIDDKKNTPISTYTNLNHNEAINEVNYDNKSDGDNSFKFDSEAVDSEELPSGTFKDVSNHDLKLDLNRIKTNLDKIKAEMTSPKEPQETAKIENNNNNNEPKLENNNNEPKLKKANTKKKSKDKKHDKGKIETKTKNGHKDKNEKKVNHESKKNKDGAKKIKDEEKIKFCDIRTKSDKQKPNEDKELKRSKTKKSKKNKEKNKDKEKKKKREKTNSLKNGILKPDTIISGQFFTPPVLDAKDINPDGLSQTSASTGYRYREDLLLGLDVGSYLCHSNFPHYWLLNGIIQKLELVPIRNKIIFISIIILYAIDIAFCSLELSRFALSSCPDHYPSFYTYINFGAMLLGKIGTFNFINFELNGSSPLNHLYPFLSTIISLGIFPAFQAPYLIYDYTICDIRSSFFTIEFAYMLTMSLSITLFGGISLILFSMLFLADCKIKDAVWKVMKSILYFLGTLVTLVLNIITLMMTFSQISKFVAALFIENMLFWFFVVLGGFTLIARKVYKVEWFKPIQVLEKEQAELRLLNNNHMDLESNCLMKASLNSLDMAPTVDKQEKNFSPLNMTFSIK